MQGSIYLITTGGSVTVRRRIPSILSGAGEGIVKMSFWDIDTSEQTSSGGGRGLISDGMKTVETSQYAGCSDHDWVMNEGEYPRLVFGETG